MSLKEAESESESVRKNAFIGGLSGKPGIFGASSTEPEISAGPVTVSNFPGHVLNSFKFAMYYIIETAKLCPNSKFPKCTSNSLYYTINSYWSFLNFLRIQQKVRRLQKLL